MFKYNHAGYPTFKGQVLNGDELWDLIEGLSANDLLFYTHLLTGYISFMSFFCPSFFPAKYTQCYSIFARPTTFTWCLDTFVGLIDNKMKDKPEKEMTNSHYFLCGLNQ
jgi:hypothetical protein